MPIIVRFWAIARDIAVAAYPTRNYTVSVPAASEMLKYCAPGVRIVVAS